MDVPQHPINGHSIAALVVLLAANLLVVHPLAVPLPLGLSDKLRTLAYLARITADDPRPPRDGVASLQGAAAAAAQDGARPAKRRLRARLGLVSAPLAGVLILLASKTIGGATVRKGIVGEAEGMKPYDIMLLFICLAYIAVSLDATGLLRYLAFVVSQKGGTSGPVLYGALWAFFFVFGALMGNDAIILSGTGFLVYLTRVTGVQPTAWVFAQFTVCNIASAVLVSSNITNLVVTSTFHINFLSYTAWMILPSLAAAAAGFLFLWLVEFRRELPRTLDRVEADPREALVDLQGAVWGAGVFLAALVALVAGSAADVLDGVWQVTVPAALLVLARDVYHDVRQDANCRPLIHHDAPPPSSPASPAPGQVGAAPSHPPAEELELGPLPSAGSTTTAAGGSSSSIAPLRPGAARQLSARLPTVQPGAERDRSSGSGGGAGDARKGSRWSIQGVGRTLVGRFQSVAYVVERLPLNLLPFSFCMFILVDGVAATGWTRVFSGWWQAWVGVSGLAGCCFGMTVVSVLLCNVIGTNIGCTIFITSILSTWQALHAPSERDLTASLYALAFGANVGAVSFTFPASLAGLLWRGLLRQKGVQVRPGEFLRRNWRVLIVCSAVASAVLLGEVAVMLPVAAT